MALAQSGAKVAMIGISEDADGLVDKIEKQVALHVCFRRCN